MIDKRCHRAATNDPNVNPEKTSHPQWKFNSSYDSDTVSLIKNRTLTCNPLPWRHCAVCVQCVLMSTLITHPSPLSSSFRSPSSVLLASIEQVEQHDRKQRASNRETEGETCAMQYDMFTIHVVLILEYNTASHMHTDQNLLCDSHSH